MVIITSLGSVRSNDLLLPSAVKASDVNLTDNQLPIHDKFYLLQQLLMFYTLNVNGVHHQLIVLKCSQCRYGNNQAWIGFSAGFISTSASLDLSWTDGATNMTFTPEYVVEVVEGAVSVCVSADSSGKWYKKECDMQQSFVCKREVGGTSIAFLFGSQLIKITSVCPLCNVFCLISLRFLHTFNLEIVL